MIVLLGGLAVVSVSCTAYRQPMTIFWSRAQHQHKPDEARRWRAKRRN